MATTPLTPLAVVMLTVVTDPVEPTVLGAHEADIEVKALVAVIADTAVVEYEAVLAVSEYEADTDEPTFRLEARIFLVPPTAPSIGK